MKNIILDISKLIGFFILMIVIDYIFYLRYFGPKWRTVIHKIMNGRMIPMRQHFAYPAYILLLIALFYFPKNIQEAMLLGFLIYGVFDFTIMTLFSDIPFYYGLIDMVWGALFMGFLYWIKSYIFI